MRVPIGTRHTATHEAEVRTAFKCRACGYEAVALVYSRGEGEATAYAFIGQRSAKERASAEATADLEANARAVATMAPCPSCHRVDEEAVSSEQNTALFKAFGIAIVVGLVGVVFFGSRRHGSEAMTLIAPVVGIVSAVMSYQKAKWRWTEVGQRVRFVNGKKANAKAKKKRLPREWTLGLVWGAALEEAKLTVPFVGSLRLGLMRHSGEGALWLEESDLDSVAPEDAFEAGRERLAAGSDGRVREVEPGIFTADWGDGFAASRLACARFEGLKLRGRKVAFTASEDTLFIAGEDDAAGLQRAFHLSAAHARTVISDASSSAGRFTAQPWLLGERGWEPWVLPEGHALRPLVAELNRELGPNAWRLS